VRHCRRERTIEQNKRKQAGNFFHVGVQPALRRARFLCVY
jgi:hypothetical protein